MNAAAPRPEGAPILVTGASGFLGRWIVDRARARGLKCVGLAGSGADEETVDLLDAAQTEAALTRAQPSVIVHAAGSHAWGQGDDDRGAAEEIAMARNLVVAAAQADTRPSLLYVGSAAEYGDLGPNPIPETAAPSPASPYGKAKLAAGEELRNRCDEAGIRFIWARVFNLVGPGQPPRAPVSNWAHQIAAAESGGQIRVGSLDLLRDFLDVRDAAAAVLELALLRPTASGAVNVCSGRGASLRDLLRRLIEISGKDIAVTADPSLTVSAPKTAIGDPSKLLALVDWRPEIALERSLADLLSATEAG